MLWTALISILKGFIHYTVVWFFILRTKKKTKLRRLYSAPKDDSTGIICDQTVRPVITKSANAYPEKLRRIKYYDTETRKRLTFLTNNFSIEARTVADLYKCRWQVELFFLILTFFFRFNISNSVSGA